MLTPNIVRGAAVLISVCFTQAAAAQTPAAINVSVKGDRLAFASVADYKRAVDQPSERTKAQIAGIVAALKGFTSFAQKPNASSSLKISPDKIASLVKDEYFASLLNSDLIVQIGDHIFRVNPSTESVYALPAGDEKDYADLVAENTRNTRIQKFSTGDNILELIQTKEKGTKRGLFCSQSGIGGRHHNVPFGGFTAFADFDRYGIFYSLSASVSPYGSSGFPYTFDFTGGITPNKGYVFYHVRCGSTASYATTTSGSWKLTYQKFQSYQGSTNLNQVYFIYRIKNSQGVFQTANVGFRVNK
jgi:hypothetical protein